MTHILGEVDLGPAHLKLEWRITIQCPTAGVQVLTKALGRDLPLQQGAYDNCLDVRRNGYQQFRALEGSHAGDEGTIQTTESSEIIFSIAADPKILKLAFEVIFTYGVQEEPTVSVEEVCRFGSDHFKFLKFEDKLCI
jgi:hypothetical protein